MQRMTHELNQYDPYHFQRIAHESCEQVRHSANDAVNKSSKLLRLFQLSFVLFAVITTFLTAFIVALYLSGELPWEIHLKAKNERNLGKALLQAVA
ncbi:MAG: hypothetical protein ACRCXC_03125 [Legionella sp.]